jgi:hypothetical protein
MKKCSFVFKLNGAFAIDLRIVIRHARNATYFPRVRLCPVKKGFPCTLYTFRQPSEITPYQEQRSCIMGDAPYSLHPGFRLYVLHTVSILVTDADQKQTCRRTQKLRTLKILCATVANAVKQGWPSQLYSENFSSGSIDPESVQQLKIMANMLHPQC